MKKLSQKIAAASAGLSALAISASNVLAYSGTPTAGAATRITLGTQEVAGAGFATNPQSVVNTVINIVFIVGAIIALAYLIMGGITWITSGGDKSKTEAARNKITAAIVGLLLLGAAYAIFMIVLGILGQSPEDLLDFGGGFSQLLSHVAMLS
ncbi:MAG: hypothetical protein LBG64_02500 [Pseudomonadales bacterium]|jgi:Sec-independent protein secretion pathway component TatC|nr:hypothetical protein [Pseudomonadales bacterium]